MNNNWNGLYLCGNKALQVSDLVKHENAWKFYFQLKTPELTLSGYAQLSNDFTALYSTSNKHLLFEKNDDGTVQLLQRGWEDDFSDIYTLAVGSENIIANPLKKSPPANAEIIHKYAFTAAFIVLSLCVVPWEGYSPRQGHLNWGYALFFDEPSKQAVVNHVGVIRNMVLAIIIGQIIDRLRAK